MFSEDEDMDSEYRPDTPEEAASKAATPHALPAGSLNKYNHTYEIFKKWNKLHGATPVTEDVLMKYFLELAEKNKPTSLWAYYSMLESTFRSKDNLDIGSYSILLDFLKQKNAGYKPIKAKVFTEQEIEKFINEAPDEQWLDLNVVCIFGVSGAYSSKKLLSIMVQHIKQYDTLLLVTIPKTATSAKVSFTITGSFFNIVQKYAELRPPNAHTDRFFLQYTNGKCTTQHIGKNKFYGMPRRIAKYLKLSEAGRYSGLSFRINNMGVNTGAWNPSSFAEEANEEDTNDYSLDYETGLLRTPSVTNSHPSVSAARNKNDYRNGSTTDHVCTIGCGKVQCAIEENEQDVLHAFTIFKPADYAITEVSPAVFSLDPTCRWIVAYTHITEPVSSFNADETFEDITTSIPNNVRVIQKYIRGNSSQLLAAYIVVYGVNCKCQRQSSDPSDIFSFSVNEIKFET